MTLGLNAVCEELPDFLVAGDDDDPPRAVHVTVPPGRNRIPGEPGLWIFILGDMTLFGAFFTALMWQNRELPALFQSSAAHLDRPIGAVNTLVLLSSSYLVVVAIWSHRRDEHRRARRWVHGALA